jgi:hypothetical protein
MRKKIQKKFIAVDCRIGTVVITPASITEDRVIESLLGLPTLMQVLKT